MPTNLQYMLSMPGSGALGIGTASIFRLDPTGTTVLEPVLDLVPGFSPLRVTLDVIDQETYNQSYRVTTNPLQDFSDTTSNVFKELATLTVNGVVSAAGPLQPFGVGLPITRLDLMRINFLRQIADAREPVMIVTPHHSLAQAFIQSLPTTWAGSDGKSIPVSISFIEARIVGPATIAAYADIDSLATGNNASSGGGQGGGETVSDVSYLDPLAA